METRKIALACCIGGCVGTAIALLVSSKFWFLGMFAGFAAGYFSYEFKEVLRAIPVALQMATNGCTFVIVKAWQTFTKFIKWLFAQPHPVYHLEMLLAIPCTFIILYFFEKLYIKYYLIEFHQVIFLTYCYYFISCFLIFLISLVLINLGLMLFEKELNVKVSAHEGFSFEEALETVFYEEFDFEKPSQYYLKVYELMLKGIVASLYFAFTIFFYTILFKGLICGSYTFTKLSVKFIYNLIKLIHSHKRLMCGIDGTLGMTAAYLFYGRTAQSTGEIIFVILCGGLVGAVFGVINYEIVSKRVLHLNGGNNNML